MTSHKKLIRIEEVKKQLPYSDNKIYDLIEEGKLTIACPNGIGKKPVFILQSSLDAYIDSIIITAEVVPD